MGLQWTHSLNKHYHDYIFFGSIEGHITESDTSSKFSWIFFFFGNIQE